MTSVADFSNAARSLPKTALSLDGLVSPARILENAPIGIYTCNPDGALVQYNRRAAEIWGHEPDAANPKHRFCGAARIFNADGTALESCDGPMSRVLRTGQSIRDFEMIVEQPGGKRITILANIDPLTDDSGNITGGVNCFQNIAEFKEIQQQMDRGRQIVRDVFEALPAALYTTDAEGRLLFFNKAAEKMWGHRPPLGTTQWCGSWKIYWPDGTLVPHDQCPMAVALKEKRAQIGPEAVVERPDGTRVPFLPYPSLIFDKDGKLVGAVNMLIDISERKQAEAHQKALIDELNHRVKNTLATVQSIAAQTIRVPGVKGREAFEARLLALSRTHDHLSREYWKSANLRSLLDMVFASYRDDARDHVQLAGEPVRLEPKIALMLALVFHELATNAAKYGALSVPEGIVDISWKIESAGDGRTLCLVWQERGGPPVKKPLQKGFGSRLVQRSLARETGSSAAMEFLPEGLRCTLGVALAV